ncbi:hypothetical protein [Rhodocista pekingensis]|uniref:Response regulatory domain-containing protein n=1 Tax=Rhodocista pekingensis TaxID=201185 RepID=A0ABW2L1E1_9PROT
MRVIIIGSQAEDLAAARAQCQSGRLAVVGTGGWQDAVRLFDATQPSAVVLASAPESPEAAGAIWSLRARDPFVAIVPPHAASAMPAHAASVAPAAGGPFPMGGLPG